MAKMISCPCGWTLISPLEEEDIKKHAMIHGKGCHPGLTTTLDEVAKMIKTVSPLTNEGRFFVVMMSNSIC
jgi:hypothetical protein